MALIAAYDPNEQLSSPSPDTANWLLNEFSPASPFLDVLDLSPDTQPGINPCSHSNNSPPTSNSFLSYFPSMNLKINSSTVDQVDFSQMAQPAQPLRLLAQPKAFYRERYYSETDKNRNRAQRFIRAEDNPSKFEYPTVEFSEIWRDPNRQLYVRVALVTATNPNVSAICVHPYAIDTLDTNVIKDSVNNSLYFPINIDEIQSGRKSFRITRKKMIQHELRAYGTLRIFDTDQKDNDRVTNSCDAKQMIDTYQLWRSQLIFTIAEQLDPNIFPTSMTATSITSQVMCDEVTGRRNGGRKGNSPTIDEEEILYAPKKGDWKGGDEILMVIPKLDKRKALSLIFDYGAMGQVSNIEITVVDTKTILFQTPACFMLVTDRNADVPIIVMQGDKIVARVFFLYIAVQSPVLIANVCPNCQKSNLNGSCKRRYSDLFEGFQSDSGVKELELDLGRLNLGSTNIKPLPSTPPSSSPPVDGKNAKFDKYLGQLQDAVVEFVRTNNPSRLFRRTRLLLAKCTDDVPPMDDAIRQGHNELLLALIDQVAEMPAPNGLLERANKDGETPLLVAAKFNRWELIESILKKRPDLARQADKEENNLLHRLAGLVKDSGEDTIKNVLAMLTEDSRTHLLTSKNKEGQTPTARAEANLNTQSANLLKTASNPVSVD